MRETEIEYEGFDCPQMGAITRIAREILIHRDRLTRAIDDRVPISFDCDGKSECVGTTYGSGISYDWTKCVHPHGKR